MNSNSDENYKRCLDLISRYGKENKSKSLKERFEEYLRTASYAQSIHVTANELVDIVKHWLPPSSETNTYDWERCLKLLSEKLR